MTDSTSSPEANSKPSPQGQFEDLTAVYINCTLKKSPSLSHTDGLMDVSRRIMSSVGVTVINHRLVDHAVAAGVYPDMTEHGWEQDAWPALYKDVARAEILVIGTPIWLGQHSSECGKLIERLYAHSGEQNEKGQYTYYGKVGGCIITGNEDGIKHIGMGVLLLPAAYWLYDSAAGGCGVDWRGGARPILLRREFRRPGE